ncbi:MAG: diguanylate cyclase, partial [Desulfobulbaceae bacterium]|nr:diguanylate cyclase [Desulfobulbaceae bacterium]
RLIRNSQTKVLVVEDSGFFRAVITNLLKVHKFQVFSVASGMEAQETIRQNPDIKLVVTDYNMPEMNGLQLTQALRRTHKREEMAIIGISAQGDQIMAANFIKYGANDFLIKQIFLTEEFYCRVNQCLDIIYNISEIKDASIKDYLTGLYNRRYLFEFGAKLFAGAIRQKYTLACGMLDLDFFKKVNDTYGHEAGDRTLRHVGRLLSERMWDTDLLARLGGEEFCILAVDVSPAKVEKLFEDIRRLIEETPVDIGGGKTISITASIGVATGGGAYSLEEMLNFADQQLYVAKQNGRNQVMAHCCDLQ